MCGGKLHFVIATIPFGIKFHKQIGIFMLTVVISACDTLEGQRVCYKLIIIINEMHGALNQCKICLKVPNTNNIQWLVTK